MISTKEVVWRAVRRKYTSDVLMYSPLSISGPFGYILYGMQSDILEGICEEVTDVFTQSHYETIAKTLGNACIRADENRDTKGRQMVVELVNDLIQVFEEDNPKFKKLRFIEAALGKANAVRGETKEE